MTTFIATLTPMLTLFLCIAIGFFTSKTGILSENAGKVMAKMETWIFCPALSFMTMMRYCTVDTVSTHATNIVIASVGVGLAMAIAIPLSRLFVRTDCPERGVYAYALAFANSGYMGDPVVKALFGDAVLSYYKLYCLPISLVIYTWGISVLTPKSEEKGALWRRLLNAPTIAMLVGIAVGMSGLGKFLPVFFVDSMDVLKDCMGPVAMLLAGVTIARYDLLGMLKKGRVYLATCLRLVVIPTVIIGLLFGLKEWIGPLVGLSIDNNVLFLSFFAIAAPLGLNTVVFPEAYGGNPETGAAMTMISHTLCVISIPLMYAAMVAIFGIPFQGM